MTDVGRNRARQAQRHRLQRLHQQAGPPEHGDDRPVKDNSAIDCGWGRLHFAHTYQSPEVLAEALRAEAPGKRDIAFYVRDPHVLLAAAPQDLFLDPSHTYRLDLATYRPSRSRRRTFFIRRLSTSRDAEAVNVIYASRGMIQVPPDYFWARRDDRALVVLVAEDAETGAILGSVMGVDHARAFGDPDLGASLWCLAVSPQAPHAGLGEALVRRLAEHCKTRGADFLDLSVMHDNVEAISLYEKLGFKRLQVFAVKKKNPFNERLFTGQPSDGALNPYARIIVDEARRRGIAAEVIDAEGGFFQLTYGGRSVRCREALSEFTSAVALSICDDKRVTRRLVAEAGVSVPQQLEEPTDDTLAAFVAQHGQVVVKPARGEQGKGVSVGLTTLEEVRKAIDAARQHCPDVIIEQHFAGLDLRLIVIDYRVVAAAIRRPARIIGDGRATVGKLIEAQSRRRSAATDGESRIPRDAETARCLAAAGYSENDIPPAGAEIEVRRTANLHTGGTIHDVTAETHPRLIDAACRAARAIEIPVTGIDLMVHSPRQPDYVFIEANERPGLANHEPQPTAERFVDLLFPLSMPQAARAAQTPET